MQIQNYRTQAFKTLATFTVLGVLALLPATAQARFTLSLSPFTVTGKPGDTGLQVLGSLSNLDNAPINFETDSFNLISGPANADLTSAIVFSDANLTSPGTPLTLGANQIYPGPGSSTFVPLLFLNVSSNAPTGLYTGNFSVTYGGQTVGKDLNINLATPVPESGTLPLLTLGLGYLFFIAYRGQRSSCKDSSAKGISGNDCTP